MFFLYISKWNMLKILEYAINCNKIIKRPVSFVCYYTIRADFCLQLWLNAISAFTYLVFIQPLIVVTGWSRRALVLTSLLPVLIMSGQAISIHCSSYLEVKLRPFSSCFYTRVSGFSLGWSSCFTSGEDYNKLPGLGRPFQSRL